jgi:hypothetical protein
VAREFGLKRQQLVELARVAIGQGFVEDAVTSILCDRCASIPLLEQAMKLLTRLPVRLSRFDELARPLLQAR